MLFDFQEFISDLRENKEKKEIIEKYEKLYGDIQGKLKDQQWYLEYVSKFEFSKYLTPEDLKDDFDWVILQQLILASFSSDYELKEQQGKEGKELYIAVKSGDQSVVKMISELRSYQLQRLYEIYIEEQMNLHILKSENDNEKMAIEKERELRQKRRKAVLETIDMTEKGQETKKEQKEQLGDLMEKL